jgi:hypothetical protein
MDAGRLFRIALGAALGGMLLFSLFESATCLCSDDDDCCGPCMLCLCTQAIETPDAAGPAMLPDAAPESFLAAPDRFASLSCRPPTPPPRA